MPQNEFSASGEVLKIDDKLGIVLGYAVISTDGGKPYYDLQGDHIPDNALLKASCDFMENSRVVKDMHSETDSGSVVFAFPMTLEIAKSLDIQVKRSGLLIGMKPSKSMFEKFRSGKLKGFSIGGIVKAQESPDA